MFAPILAFSPLPTAVVAPCPPPAPATTAFAIFTISSTSSVSTSSTPVSKSRGLADDINTACDLSAAFTNLFRATALGYIKPKTAHTLTYLGNLMLQTHLLAKQEYESAFENDPWPDVVAGSICSAKRNSSPTSLPLTLSILRTHIPNPTQTTDPAQSLPTRHTLPPKLAMIPIRRNPSVQQENPPLLQRPLAPLPCIP